MPQKSVVVGIDLGTTNSVIAITSLDNKSTVVLTNRSGRKTFPSAIVYDKKKDGIVAGQVAYNKRGNEIEPILSIKQHMGDPDYRATTGPLTFDPIGVSAELLKAMRQEMQAYLNAMPEYADYLVDRAVITIPAHFSAAAREATTRAAEQAGFTVEKTLQEPTSAALYYSQNNGISNGTYMVYDLGGGTFDVSIVRIHEGDAFVLAIAGNNYLGGDNFDELLAGRLAEIIRSDPDGDYDFDLDMNDPADRRRFARIRGEAENIKKRLSETDEYFHEVSGVCQDKSGNNVNLAVSMTRDEFDDLIRPLIESSFKDCRQALCEAEEKHGITLDMIDGVLLVGGSTHIPLVAEMVEAAFTDPGLAHHTRQPKPLRDNPDMAVGFGAAISAASYGVIERGTEYTAATKPGTGFGGLSTVEGQLSAVSGKLPDALYARVTRAAGGFRKEYPLEADGSFVFEELPAESESEMYACEFFSGDTPIYRITFDAAIRNPVDAKVVLSRSFYLEKMNALTGKTERVCLMEKGTNLPYATNPPFEFHTTNPYSASLPFYEGPVLIRTIQMVFEKPVQPGTPVSLTVACDVKSVFRVDVVVDNKHESAVFEPVKPPPPDPNALEKAAHAALERVKALPTKGEQLVEEQAIKSLYEEGKQARANKDVLRELDIIDRISHIPEITGPVELEPTREVFEAKVSRITQALNTCENPEVDKPDLGRQLQDAAVDGRAAYDAGSQDALSATVSKLDAIAKLVEDKKTPPPPPKWVICVGGAQEAVQMMESVVMADNLPAEKRAEYAKEAAEDRTEMLQIAKSINQFSTDQAVEEAFEKVRKIYTKWHERYTQMQQGDLVR